MFPGSTRFGLRFSDASWLCPIRFGPFLRPVPAGSRIKRFSSVRFGRFGSDSYSFLYFCWIRLETLALNYLRPRENGNQRHAWKLARDHTSKRELCYRS